MTDKTGGRVGAAEWVQNMSSNIPSDSVRGDLDLMIYKGKLVVTTPIDNAR